MSSSTSRQGNVWSGQMVRLSYLGHLSYRLRVLLAGRQRLITCHHSSGAAGRRMKSPEMFFPPVKEWAQVEVSWLNSWWEKEAVHTLEDMLSVSSQSTSERWEVRWPLCLHLSGGWAGDLIPKDSDGKCSHLHGEEVTLSSRKESKSK